jgi:hypothetical protein
MPLCRRRSPPMGRGFSPWRQVSRGWRDAGWPRRGPVMQWSSQTTKGGGDSLRGGDGALRRSDGPLHRELDSFRHHLQMFART